jgi:type II secretory pathway pseudopilin PulG
MSEMKQKMSSWMKLVSAMLVVAFAITLLAPAGKGFIAYAEEATTQVAQQTEEETTEQQKTEEQKAQEEAEAAEQARAKKWKKILIGGLVVGGVLVVLAAAGNSSNTGRVETSSGTKTSTSTSNNALTVVDNDECSIKITGTTNTIYGEGLKIKLQNKSSTKNYMFSLESAAINGVQVTALGTWEVEAGNSASKEIYFMLSDDEKNEIGTYKQIKLTYRVYNWDNWSEAAVANVTVTYYP